MILLCNYKYVISFVFVFKIIIKKEPCRYGFFDEFKCTHLYWISNNIENSIRIAKCFRNLIYL